MIARPGERSCCGRCSRAAAAPKIDEVTFKGFRDEFERQGVPAFRDATVDLIAKLDGGVFEAFSAAAVKAAPKGASEAVVAELRRRCRGNAIDLPRVAELYRAGGADKVSETEGISIATAFRWVKAARDAGVLEPRS